MPFTKTTWVEDSPPYLNAAQLNRMETGISEAYAGTTLPMFSAYRAALQANGIPNNSTGSPVIFDTKEYDTHGWYDVATGRFTPQEPGRYELIAAVMTTTTAAAGPWQLVLCKNGAIHRYLYIDNATTAAGAYTVAGNAIVDANGTTDYFDIRVYQNTGSAKDLQGGVDRSFFQAVKVDRRGPQGDAGATTGVPLVTALPSNPVNGQEVYFADATMAANGLVWHLRYNSGSASTYKWEYIGGPPMRGYLAGDVNVTVFAQFTDPAVPGPDVTVPLNGEYDVTYGARMRMNASGLEGSVAVFDPAGNNRGMVIFDSAIANEYYSGATTDPVVVVTGTRLLRMRYYASAAGVAFGYRWMKVTPIRVG